MMLMFHRRCLHVAACIAPVRVTFDYNGVRMILPIELFEDYVKLFYHSQHDEKLDDAGRANYSSANGSDVDNYLTNDTISVESSAESSSYSYSRVNQRWELGVRLSTSGSFESMSFVDNDGRGIPVEKHPTEHIYIPE